MGACQACGLKAEEEVNECRFDIGDVDGAAADAKTAVADKKKKSKSGKKKSGTSKRPCSSEEQEQIVPLAAAPAGPAAAAAAAGARGHTEEQAQAQPQTQLQEQAANPELGDQAQEAHQPQPPLEQQQQRCDVVASLDIACEQGPEEHGSGDTALRECPPLVTDVEVSPSQEQEQEQAAGDAAEPVCDADVDKTAEREAPSHAAWPLAPSVGTWLLPRPLAPRPAVAAQEVECNVEAVEVHEEAEKPTGQKALEAVEVHEEARKPNEQKALEAVDCCAASESSYAETLPESVEDATDPVVSKELLVADVCGEVLKMPAEAKASQQAWARLPSVGTWALSHHPALLQDATGFQHIVDRCCKAEA